MNDWSVCVEIIVHWFLFKFFCKAYTHRLVVQHCRYVNK